MTGSADPSPDIHHPTKRSTGTRASPFAVRSWRVGEIQRAGQLPSHLVDLLPLAAFWEGGVGVFFRFEINSHINTLQAYKNGLRYLGGPKPKILHLSSR